MGSLRNRLSISRAIMLSTVIVIIIVVAIPTTLVLKKNADKATTVTTISGNIETIEVEISSCRCLLHSFEQQKKSLFAVVYHFFSVHILDFPASTTTTTTTAITTTRTTQPSTYVGNSDYGESCF